MKKLLLFTAVLLSVSSASFAATLNSMNKAEIMKTLSEKTLTTIPLVTINAKLVNNSFSGYLDKSGKVTGQMSNKPEGNDPQNDEGTWKVSDEGVLCVTWQHWNQAKPICTHVYNLKNSLVFMNLKNTLETLALKNDIKSGNQLH